MTLNIEIIELGQEFPACSDRGCDLDSSVYISEQGKDKKPWCTGHAHVEIACFMVGL